MKNRINVCDIYLLITCLYLVRNYIHFAGGVFSRVLLIMLLAMSLIFTIYGFVRLKQPKVLKALGLFVLLYTVSEILLIISGEERYVWATGEYVPTGYHLFKVWRALLPIFVFYTFSRLGFLTEQKYRFWALLFVLTATMQYVAGYSSSMEMYDLANDEVTNNAGYAVLALIPVLISVPYKNSVKYILLLIATVFIIIAMKRGPIFICAVLILWYLFINLNTVKGYNKWGLIILSLILLAVITYFIKNIMMDNLHFVNRLEQTLDGDSSGRDEIIDALLYYYFHETNITQFIFGSGAEATLKVFVIYAHNDWVEIAVNQGLLGVLIYGAYWFYLIKLFINSRKTKLFHEIIGSFVIIYFSSTLISMSYSEVQPYAACVFGLYLYKYEVAEQKQKNELIKNKSDNEASRCYSIR